MSAAVHVHDDSTFAAGDLYRSGVRSVELARPVDLTTPSPEDHRAMDVVRNATARGMRVVWELSSLPSSITVGELSHLHPPRRIGGDESVAGWWDAFYLGRCCWRQGPGFVQIRDRRDRRLVKFTVTEPDLIEAIQRLDRGEPVPAEAVAPLVDEHLVLMLGEQPWLAPYRAVRWPSPSLTA